MQVVHEDGGHRLSGSGGDVSLANRYLDHLSTRAFAATTIRTYAFHLLSFFRFCEEHDIGLASVQPTDFFEFLDWLSQRQRNGKVIRLASGAAPATMNQRIAAVRGLPGLVHPRVSHSDVICCGDATRPVEAPAR